LNTALARRLTRPTSKHTVFVDSHCHLDFPELKGRLPAVLDAMAANEVTHALCISVNLPALPGVLSLAADHAQLYASVGVHPDSEDTPEPTVHGLIELARRPKVVAIGETGLDYYRLTGDLEWQRQRFRTHIRAARACGKPLVIHTRAASDDTIRIMREEAAGEAGGVMHCFTESWETAEAALEQGFHISFSGIVTFKNAQALKDVARRVPLERMLIETDAPYLAPVPHRGKTNEPAYVRHVAEEIARLRGIALDELAAATSTNFFRLFRVNPHAH
jgi:TatD DNase family protein